MKNRAQMVVTVGLKPQGVAGRTVEQLMSAEDIRRELVDQLVPAARDAGVHVSAIVVQIYDTPGALEAAPMPHPCAGCTAARDQAIAGLREGLWAAVATGLLLGHPGDHS